MFCLRTNLPVGLPESQSLSGGETVLEIDGDVKTVVDFMLRKVPTTKLAVVVSAVSELAPILWGHYPKGENRSLRLAQPPI